MSLPLCQILAFQPAWYLLYLVNLVKKRQLVKFTHSLPLCQILAFQPAWYLLYLVNLVKKRQLGNSHLPWQSQSINNCFLVNL